MWLFRVYSCCWDAVQLKLDDCVLLLMVHGRQSMCDHGQELNGS